jgi:hypothetical protein
VNAYENLVPNPAWPYLDDAGRDGHFLTTTGTPPLCPGNTCSNNAYQCVAGACNGQACCMPKAVTWQNLPGYEVASAPADDEVKVLRPDVPYNQLDGAFGVTGGSEPAFNLSTYLGSVYKNNRQVTLLTGANGPGDQDLWMSGYLDGCGDILLATGKGGATRKAAGCEGKISYLAGHKYSTSVPVTSKSEGHGTRLFLNALFEAQCTVGGGGGGGADSDGDGVDDGNDPYPDDPTRCGDSDGDGCDDCASGVFDPDNDCDIDGGGGASPGGCCDTSRSSERNLIVAVLVGHVLLRPRRRRR